MGTTTWHLRNWAWLCCLLTWSVAAPLMAQKKAFTVVLDAGHGGKDAGAVGKVTTEKAINLNVALALGHLIEQEQKDVKVVYTRKTDVFLTLDQRAKVANEAKADLFISIHTNAAPAGSTARGAETYTLGMHRAKDNLDVAKRENSVILYEKDYKTNYAGFDPSKAESYIIFELMQDQYMKQSVDFARKIQQQYSSVAKRKNKGVHQAGFLVLRATSMPAVLTELGFISTPDEEHFLHSADGVKKLAQSLYNAFVAYKNEQLGKHTRRTTKNTAKGEEAPKAPTSKKKEIDPNASLATTNDSLRWQPTPIDSTRGTLIAITPPSLAKQATLPEQQELPVRDDTASQALFTTPTDTTNIPTTEIKPTEVPLTATPTSSTTAIEYRVQIFATSTRLTATDRRIAGLEALAYYEEGGLYKYTIGHATSEHEAIKLRKTLTARFPQCFVIALRDGKRISLAEARATHH